jgi:hypothetical protein
MSYKGDRIVFVRNLKEDKVGKVVVYKEVSNRYNSIVVISN